MGDLPVAHLGGDRSRADQEEERLCLFDASIDLLFPVLPLGDAFPIDPGIELISCQRVNDLLRNIEVSAGVGNEDLRHAVSFFAVQVLRFVVELFASHAP